jgi:hypothetical protein
VWPPSRSLRLVFSRYFDNGPNALAIEARARASSAGPRSSFMAQVSVMAFQKLNGGVADDASPVAGGIA